MGAKARRMRRKRQGESWNARTSSEPAPAARDQTSANTARRGQQPHHHHLPRRTHIHPRPPCSPPSWPLPPPPGPALRPPARRAAHRTRLRAPPARVGHQVGPPRATELRAQPTARGVAAGAESRGGWSPLGGHTAGSALGRLNRHCRRRTARPREHALAPTRAHPQQTPRRRVPHRPAPWPQRRHRYTNGRRRGTVGRREEGALGHARRRVRGHPQREDEGRSKRAAEPPRGAWYCRGRSANTMGETQVGGGTG